MKEFTVKELELQLQDINHRIARLRNEELKARTIYNIMNGSKKKPFLKKDTPLVQFHVITDSNMLYNLSAYTNNPKKWATSLHEETGCTVREGAYVTPMPEDGK